MTNHLIDQAIYASLVGSATSWTEEGAVLVSKDRSICPDAVLIGEIHIVTVKFYFAVHSDGTPIFAHEEGLKKLFHEPKLKVDITTYPAAIKLQSQRTLKVDRVHGDEESEEFIQRELRNRLDSPRAARPNGGGQFL